MSFFENLFSKKSETPSFWIPITSLSEFHNALQQSESSKIVIFKHSTRCMISKTVLRNFEKEIQEKNPKAIFYLLDLLQHRSISNAISEQLEITHQSPQVIIIKNREVKNHASHENISVSLV